MPDIPCIDGPAYINKRGTQYWCKDGHLHRSDGPAVVYQGGSMGWWWYNEEYDFEKWLEANDEISDSKKLFLKLKYG